MDEAKRKKFQSKTLELQEFDRYLAKRIQCIPEFGQAFLWWLGLLDINTIIQEFESRSEDEKEDQLKKAEIVIDFNNFKLEMKHGLLSGPDLCNDDLIDATDWDWMKDANQFLNSKPLCSLKDQYQTNLQMFDQLEIEYTVDVRTRGKTIKNFFASAQYDHKEDPIANQRQRLILNFYLHEYTEHFSAMCYQSRMMKQCFDELKEEEVSLCSELFRNKDVIAMTTVDAAKYKSALTNVGSKITIVQEAGQILESHVIASLLDSTEHLILIGDHKGSRPRIISDATLNGYNLDVSLLERLIANDFKNVCLRTQHRMRPEISGLTRLKYPDLINGPSVSQIPRLEIFDRDLLFFTHEWPEETDESGWFQNKLEADFILKFAELLIKYGYKSQKIHILSLFNGQILYLKKSLSKFKSLDGIGLSHLSDFQGEENDIVLISLVESNPENEISEPDDFLFLNAGFSCARQGLFLFGNAECIRNHQLQKYSADRSKSDWLKLLDYLEHSKALISEFTFKCFSHSEEMLLKDVSDFDKCPNGGCRAICGAQLACGHTCSLFCHKYEITADNPDGHSSQRCTKLCDRAHECGHPCSLMCSNCSLENFKCKKNMHLSHPKCGHPVNAKCFQISLDPSKIKCLEKCHKTLSCGHPCTKTCSEVCSSLTADQAREGFISLCTVEIDFVAPCGHIRKKPCGLSVSEFMLLDLSCKEFCCKTLKCGHLCQKNCTDCTNDRLKECLEFHGACDNRCIKTLPCGHECYDKCSNTEFCSSCQQTCRNKCLHGNCSNLCGEICTKCLSPCLYKCPHFKCTLNCSDICNRPPCSDRCTKITSCGHLCLGFCGEVCPEICRICDPDNPVFYSPHGDARNENARFIRLDCGHCFESKFLDAHFENAQISPIVKYVTCPECNIPILFCMRYQSQIKTMIRQIDDVKDQIQLRLKNIYHTTLSQKVSYFDGIGLEWANSVEIRNFSQKISEKIKNMPMEPFDCIILMCILHYAEFYLKFAVDKKNRYEQKRLEAFTKPFRDKLLSWKFSGDTKMSLDRGVEGMRLFWGWTDLQSATNNYWRAHNSKVAHKKAIYELTIRKLAALARRNCFISQDLLDENLKDFQNASKCFLHINLSTFESMEFVKDLSLIQGRWPKCRNGHSFNVGEWNSSNQEPICQNCLLKLKKKKKSRQKHSKKTADQRDKPESLMI